MGKKLGEYENVGAGEQVLAILRKEGKEVRPADTRCKVKVEGKNEKGKDGDKRCPEEIHFDKESGNWMKCCEGHFNQEKTAREEGGERLEWIDES